VFTLHRVVHCCRPPDALWRTFSPCRSAARRPRRACPPVPTMTSVRLDGGGDRHVATGATGVALRSAGSPRRHPRSSRTVFRTARRRVPPSGLPSGDGPPVPVPASPERRAIGPSCQRLQGRRGHRSLATTQRERPLTGSLCRRSDPRPERPRSSVSRRYLRDRLTTVQTTYPCSCYLGS
jgi:hypothetical protein